MRRVVVTGMGAITPIGLNVEEFWKGIHAGQIGFGPITKFDASEYKAHLAAEVKGFVGKEHMDFKAAKRMELFAQYAVAAAKEAVADAGLDMEKEDAYRCGTAVGCGVGSLQAIEREYTKIVEKVGYGCSADAYHITSPLEDGAGAARAMQNAIEDAGVDKNEITYINAHGTATHHNDLFETRAIKLLFGDHAKDIKINSTKSMIGHLLGAAGAVEFITCVKELEEGYIHRTVGYETPDDEMDLNYCKEESHESFTYALSNSLGFGGHNASLLVRKYEE